MRTAFLAPFSSFVGFRTFSASSLVCVWVWPLLDYLSLSQVLNLYLGCWNLLAAECVCLTVESTTSLCSATYPCYPASLFGSMLFLLCLRCSLTTCKMILPDGVSLPLVSILHDLIFLGHFNGSSACSDLIIPLLKLVLCLLSGMGPSALNVI
jgi:hypothetical protein